MMDTPEFVFISEAGKTMPEMGLRQRLAEKRPKKSEKKALKGIAIRKKIGYNMTVVCLGMKW